MRWFRPFLLVIFATWLGCSSAFAEKRVALVIGNSDYQKVARLSNPVNDAAAIATMLRAAGFDLVESRLNLRVGEMRRTLRDFGAKARDADMAVVYYAGHGIELDGMNYLIPVDATLETDADVLDETLPLDRVLFAVEPVKHLRLVILDACRDNPFATTMKRTIAARAIGRGLAKVEPTSPNTLIAFAAKAGSVASDGDSKISPFSSALVEHLPKAGLDIRKAFGYVRDDVLRNTNNRQEPYVYGSLGGDDVPLVPAKPASGPQPSPQSEVRRDYELALQTGDRDAWEAFLRTYPTGFYADLARVQLKKIAAEDAKAAATEKARLAQQEKERLAAEGAKKVEQAKAAAVAKAAEEARLAAEKAKQIEAEKAAAAERARAAAEQAAAERLVAEKAAAEKLAVEKKAADEKAAAEKTETKAAEARPAAGQAASSTPKQEAPDQLAALTPEPSRQGSSLSAAETVTRVQAELRRVGCFTGAVSDEWTNVARRSLERFNKYSGLKLDPKAASLDILGAVKSKTARVCPLTCDHGYRAEGDNCVRITCKTGYRIGDDNTCEKIDSRKRAAKSGAPGTGSENRREQTQTDEGAILRAQIDRSALPAGPAPPDLPTSGPRVTMGGRTACGPRGCQLVPKGCHAVRNVAGGHDLGGKIFCP